jgi:hypothetical protein
MSVSSTVKKTSGWHKTGFPIDDRGVCDVTGSINKHKIFFLIPIQLYLFIKQLKFSPEFEKRAFILSFKKISRL